jgi:predicted Zn-dependent peptidase
LSDRYFQHTFGNGLTLLGEQMSGMQSAAMTLLVPAGASLDPQKSSGIATVLSELVLRGAGSRDSRALTAYLDNLGLQRSSGAGIYHTRFACAAVATNVLESLPAYADIVRRPHLPEIGFQAACDLALQGLDGIDDDPRQKAMLKLREWHFPWPYGRNTMGEKAHLEKLTLDDCKSHFVRTYQPHGAVMAIAGRIDFARVTHLTQQTFGDWKGHLPPSIPTIPSSGHLHHEEHQSEQTHIAIGYKTIEETHPDYYVMRLGIEALSGGMSGRLFTEIREKRGLVYNVSAGYSSLKGFGSILGYAGTSNDRAQATLDVFIAELQRLSEGITQEELDRAKIGLKASTIMQGESTSARAGAIAHDFFMRGRIRTLDEIKAAIDGATLDQVNAYLKMSRPEKFTIVTVGPKPLKVPS